MKNRLEELRKQRAIRQEDLAQALGVSRQTVISLEKGKYNPSLALAFKLARYFGCPSKQSSTTATNPPTQRCRNNEPRAPLRGGHWALTSRRNV